MSQFLFITYLLTRRVDAAPTNITALRTEIAPMWVDDPPGRGTWSLVYSNVFTILVCVYTAIHMNIPPIGDTNLMCWARKIKWVIIAIFAPEIVVFTAFLQWLKARTFLAKLLKIVSENENPNVMNFHELDGSESRFDMLYAYYTVMGGFVIDVEDLDNNMKTVTLTPRGLLFLAKSGHFCHVRRTDIQDKSKADVLAKSLACLQILWVIVQALERKIADYPITLLELHTIAHIICALIMYGMWIQKPLNIQEPTMVVFGDNPEIVAVLLQRDVQIGFSDTILLDWLNIHNDVYVDVDSLTASTEPGSQNDLHTIGEREEIVANSDGQLVSTRFCTFVNGSTGKSLRPMGPLHENPYLSPEIEKVACVLYSGQTLHSVIGLQLPEGECESYSPLYPFPMNNRYIGLFQPINSISLSEKDVRRLGLVVSWVTKLKAQGFTGSQELSHLESEENTSVDLKDLLMSMAQGEDSVHPLLESDSLISKRAYNIALNMDKSIEDSSDFSSLAPVGVALAVLSGIYGGVHLTALDGIFPTSVEKLLWTIASSVLLGYAGITFLLSLILCLDTLINHALTSRRKRHWLQEHPSLEGFQRPNSVFMALFKFGLEAGKILDHMEKFIGNREKHTRREWLKFIGLASLIPFWGTVVVIAGIGGWSYSVSRLYLIVESFISLRHVPIGVYETPDLNIVGYFPHI
ncbi:hypothetical protein B7494_g1095 [Chlorociboria aeruginascens]|nr:hypothetical protein B7494_g1095 [Chlorociboria aeruginascens]